MDGFQISNEPLYAEATVQLVSFDSQTYTLVRTLPKQPIIRIGRFVLSDTEWNSATDALLNSTHTAADCAASAHT